MQVFVTGATGYIGSAVVNELIHAGHRVVGLARSESGAEKLKRAGAEVQKGALDDLDCLRSAALAADGVIHLAFNNDFSDFANSLKVDLNAVKAMGAALEGSNKPFVITDHMNGTESVNALFTLSGVRMSVISLPPTVHGDGRYGFVSILMDIARSTGVSAYVGDGSNRWPSVHRLDAANLYRLALEKAPEGSQLIGRAEEGVLLRDIAEVIGKRLSLPVVSISHEEADAHFGFLGGLMKLDIPSSQPMNGIQTKELLGWRPIHPTLIADLEHGD